MQDFVRQQAETQAQRKWDAAQDASAPSASTSPRFRLNATGEELPPARVATVTPEPAPTPGLSRPLPARRHPLTDEARFSGAPVTRTVPEAVLSDDAWTSQLQP
jgi:hypothetical protein